MTVEIQRFDLHGVKEIADRVGISVSSLKKRVTEPPLPETHPRYHPPIPVTRDSWGRLHAMAIEIDRWTCRVGLARVVYVGTDPANQTNHTNHDEGASRP